MQIVVDTSENVGRKVKQDTCCDYALLLLFFSLSDKSL